MALGAPVLSARGLTVARDSKALLKGIDLALHPGEVVAILGPNGVGKSSLLEVLAGLLPPAAGSVERTGRVAAAFQSPAMARRTVQGNVEAALGWWGVARAERPQRATEALQRMRAGHLAGRRATELSGGETRRVHLARALALDAEILLLDEPFAGLDPVARGELLADASRVLRDPRRATLVVLHDRAEAWALADRLVILLDGAIAADSAPKTLLDRPPDPRTAAFLGFTGRMTRPDGTVVCTRPGQVSIVGGSAAGPPAIDGVVDERVPEEDGVLCRARVDGGHLTFRAAHPGPAVGDPVHLLIDGDVQFPSTGDGAP